MPEQEKPRDPLPTPTLPKGGRATRDIGEKFIANLATDAGSLSVPIFTSPGRGGFHPQLTLNYDSGGGNGPFGVGWSLSIPSISRKTDKGLPLYRDAEDSDVFILSGAEDLVPSLLNQGKAPPGKIDVKPSVTPSFRFSTTRPTLPAMDTSLENGSGYVWVAMYTMWVHKYGQCDLPAIKNEAKQTAKDLLESRFPSTPTLESKRASNHQRVVAAVRGHLGASSRTMSAETCSRSDACRNDVCGNSHRLDTHCSRQLRHGFFRETLRFPVIDFVRRSLASARAVIVPIRSEHARSMNFWLETSPDGNPLGGESSTGDCDTICSRAQGADVES